MPYPTLLADAPGVVLTGDFSASWPVLCVLALVVLAWGEARVHIASLREWKREATVEIASLKAQVSSLEVRDGRTAERLDHMAKQLDGIGADVKALLRRESAA
jgi:hypothetical protein